MRYKIYRNLIKQCKYVRGCYVIIALVLILVSMLRVLPQVDNNNALLKQEKLNYTGSKQEMLFTHTSQILHSYENGDITLKENEHKAIIDTLNKYNIIIIIETWSMCFG